MLTYFLWAIGATIGAWLACWVALVLLFGYVYLLGRFDKWKAMKTRRGFL